MPVIEQFKAFIRHGRAAKDNHYEGEQRQQQQGHVSRGTPVSQQAATSASSSSPHNQQGQSTSSHHNTHMSHPAETTNRHPQAPIGSGTATANEVYSHAVHDKSASVAAISQAMASGQTAAGGHKGNSQAASTAAAAMGGGQQGKDAQNYTKEAERIVEEERLASEKLPVYPGLEERFTLLCKMGDGAFSNVYKARDRKTGQKVAIKVVRKYELNTSQRANILKEVQIMRNFKHPGIVELLEFSESRDHYYLILELLEGGELFHQIVKLTYFSEALARHVILQVANGIRYLHEERGVIHRDIKPENLLFESINIIPSKVDKARPYDEEKEDEGEFVPGIGGGGIGRVKVADFGLSKVVWEESTMTPCGTVGYTAPEIVKDERYSKSVDMWALGCVLYTLLCGFPPFYDESITVLTEKVAKGYYTFLSPWWDDISGSAKDLITHLLCVDSNRRYTIDEFLAHPWCNAKDPVPNLDSADIALAHMSEMPLDSPLLQSMKKVANPRSLMSPGINQLKEAFDVTYAVHRQGEEGRRKGNANLHGLNEEDEEDEEYEEEEEHPATAAPTTSTNRSGDALRYRQELKQRTQQQAANARSTKITQQQGADQQYQGRGGADRKMAEAALYEGRAGTRDRGAAAGGSGARRKNFELNMGNATLLGRRNKGVQPPNGGFSLNGLNLGGGGEPSALHGSPMRVD